MDDKLVKKIGRLLETQTIYLRKEIHNAEDRLEKKVKRSYRQEPRRNDRSYYYTLQRRVQQS